MGGHHHHAHDSHDHGRSSDATRLATMLVLVALYMVAEVVAGLVTRSLALLADAGHMFSDLAALGLSLFAVWVAGRPATPTRSFGYYRAEILAALANSAALIAVSIIIFVEAVQRLRHPVEVEGPLMLAVAAGGLVVNLIGLWVLNGGKAESLNLRGAWLHVLTDALGSVQAIAAGGLIWAFGWTWADPVASMLIGVLVIFSSWRLLQEALAVLMEGVPAHIDLDQVRDTMATVPGVVAVRDLHVWTITTGLVSLSAHVGCTDERPSQTMLCEIRDALHDRFGIDHITIQIEPEEFERRHVPV
jgi:cobalt-zinc-cadmium efflux system protein